ncbi:MAG: MBL fold metallo-hydrolase [Terrimicrobiaceae bacterium]
MGELEITFLGTGTSHGIPVIGCQCQVCHSADPRDRRLRTSTILRHEGYQIQIDTTPDFRQQCLREGLVQIDAVLYTHSHSDHIMGFDDLRRFCEMENKDMPVYGSRRTLQDLARVFDYAFSGNFRYPNYVRPLPNAIDGPFELGGLTVTPVELPHGRMVTTGFVFSTGERKLLAYFTDCQDVPQEAVAAARGCEILVVDALRHANHPTHMSLSQATGVAEQVAAHQTYFIHMCHELGHAETEELLPDNIRLAYDGLRVTISGGPPVRVAGLPLRDS